jgi:hypothetical protein
VALMTSGRPTAWAGNATSPSEPITPPIMQARHRLLGMHISELRGSSSAKLETALNRANRLRIVMSAPYLGCC